MKPDGKQSYVASHRLIFLACVPCQEEPPGDGLLSFEAYCEEVPFKGINLFIIVLFTSGLFIKRDPFPTMLIPVLLFNCGLQFIQPLKKDGLLLRTDLGDVAILSSESVLRGQNRTVFLQLSAYFLDFLQCGFFRK